MKVNMNKIIKNGDDMLKEYDFSSGVRGKYVRRLRKGSNVIVLDADVAKVFSSTLSDMFSNVASPIKGKQH